MLVFRPCRSVAKRPEERQHSPPASDRDAAYRKQILANTAEKFASLAAENALLKARNADLEANAAAEAARKACLESMALLM
jgi:hypothetical protein